MTKKGMYYVPSINNYESKDDVLILVTDFGLGRMCGINILNQDDFEFDESSEPEGFEYYYEPATNGDIIKALFPNEHDFETDFDVGWWNAPYQNCAN